jgi:hypothetical protein
MTMDIVLFPHCDMHVHLENPPDLKISVWGRDLANDNKSYKLEKITSLCDFDYFAPYEPIGNRLKRFVDIDRDGGTGKVTPIDKGINLIQVRYRDIRDNYHYIIARIQVHNKILSWWFGNSSITTAQDSKFAHAQPSLCALFSDDPFGTDDVEVGDITGHGYIKLTSTDSSIFSINNNGRLQGIQEGNAQLTGEFLATSHTLPVKVVDYGKARAKLEYVKIPNVYHPEEMSNILFIPEGFRDTKEDRQKFDAIVTNVVDEMFNKPRHEPYPLLEGSFNVWKAYESSKQHALTCGYRVNGKFQGYPIPYEYSVSDNSNIYTVQALIAIVGLPLRSENREPEDLIELWKEQFPSSFDIVDPADPNKKIKHFDPRKVDTKLVEAWKGQKSLGILEARDTFFGLYLGARYGDQLSRKRDEFVLPPVNDSNSDAKLAPFVKRIHEWFTIKASRSLTPDPRRHPPENYRLEI